MKKLLIIICIFLGLEKNTSAQEIPIDTNTWQFRMPDNAFTVIDSTDF